MNIRTLRGASVLGCLVVTVFLSALVALQVETAVRSILAITFYLTVPGWAVVAWLDIDDGALAWVIAIGISIAAGILVAEAMLVGHVWHPGAAYWTVATASGALLVTRLIRPALSAASSDHRLSATQTTPDANRP